MKALLAIISILSIFGSSNGFPRRINYVNESTLELVHVLFRHGDRNPEAQNIYPSYPFYNESNFYPYGHGELTNAGRMRIYNVGVALRQRYNNFLGKVWNTTILDVRTTDYKRTKMSAQLLLAGLWPPSCVNVWNSPLHWQPIPYDYEKKSDDKELSSFLGCTTFNPLVDEVLTTQVGTNMAERYNETMNILANRTGYNMTYLQAFMLYFGFVMMEELNLPVEEWASAVYPEPLYSLAMDYYYLETNTTQLRRLMAGYFLKKIIADTQSKINGTLSLENRKMFIYAGHETNIAGLLICLEAYKKLDIPPYGSYLLFEVHNIDGVHGIKLFYQDYTTEDPQLLQILGCAEFCPLDEFVSLVQELLPSSDEECYGSTTKYLKKS